jgi:hypothetical protein
MASRMEIRCGEVRAAREMEVGKSLFALCLGGRQSVAIEGSFLAVEGAEGAVDEVNHAGFFGAAGFGA